jgi:hypothetical protein
MSESETIGTKSGPATTYLEETREGMHEKDEQELWPSCAPLGYRNVRGLNGKKTIEPDPTVAPLHQGSYTPSVSRDLWDRVQATLNHRLVRHAEILNGELSECEGRSKIKITDCRTHSTHSIYLTLALICV